MEYSDIIKFHGHECPGLAMGYRMAKAGMEALKAIRSEDEEIVAIVENDACGVDALQCVTGCTFGKGNLIFHDYGKQVYTLYSRGTGEGIRVSFHGKGMPENLGNNMKARLEHLLKAPESDIMTITRVKIDEPEPARIHASVICEKCGERVMETRVHVKEGKKLCIPCSN
jgi:formylmethanofuran dehydrogenase subunit E